MLKIICAPIAILKVALVACTLLISAWAVLKLFIWLTPYWSVSQYIRNQIFGGTVVVATVADPMGLGEVDNPNEQERVQEIFRDHGSIVNTLMACNGAISPSQFAERYIAEFFVSFTWPTSKGQMTLSSVQTAVVHLSHSVSVERLLLTTRVLHAYKLLTIATFATIAIEMITTVLVTLSSTDLAKDNKVVWILAIIFPAFGTAAAGLVAFYSPQTTYTQTSNTIASLRVSSTAKWHTACWTRAAMTRI